MGNCNKCNSPSQSCSCKKAPVCKTGCIDTISTDCVIYDKGPNKSKLLCALGLDNKISLTKILEKVDDTFCISPSECAQTKFGLGCNTPIDFAVHKLLDYVCKLEDTKVKVSKTDTQAGYLFDKIKTDGCIKKTIIQDSKGVQQLELSIDLACLNDKLDCCDGNGGGGNSPINITGTDNVCGDNTTTLTAVTTLPGTITWSNGTTGPTITVIAGTYTAFLGSVTSNSFTVSNTGDCTTGNCGPWVNTGGVNCDNNISFIEQKNNCGEYQWILGGNACNNSFNIVTSAYSICESGVATLTAFGCTSAVTWSNGSSGSTLNVNSSGTYFATCNGVQSNSITITYYGDCDTCVGCDGFKISANVTKVCGANVATLSVVSNCGEKLFWSNGIEGDFIEVNQTGTYWAYCGGLKSNEIFVEYFEDCANCINCPPCNNCLPKCGTFNTVTPLVEQCGSNVHFSLLTCVEYIKQINSCGHTKWTYNEYNPTCPNCIPCESNNCVDEPGLIGPLDNPLDDYCEEFGWKDNNCDNICGAYVPITAVVTKRGITSPVDKCRKYRKQTNTVTGLTRYREILGVYQCCDGCPEFTKAKCCDADDIPVITKELTGNTNTAIKYKVTFADPDTKFIYCLAAIGGTCTLTNSACYDSLNTGLITVFSSGDILTLPININAEKLLRIRSFTDGKCGCFLDTEKTIKNTGVACVTMPEFEVELFTDTDGIVKFRTRATYIGTYNITAYKATDVKPACIDSVSSNEVTFNFPGTWKTIPVTVINPSFYNVGEVITFRFRNGTLGCCVDTTLTVPNYISTKNSKTKELVQGLGLCNNNFYRFQFFIKQAVPTKIRLKITVVLDRFLISNKTIVFFHEIPIGKVGDYEFCWNPRRLFDMDLTFADFEVVTPSNIIKL